MFSTNSPSGSAWGHNFRLSHHNSNLKPATKTLRSKCSKMICSNVPEMCTWFLNVKKIEKWTMDALEKSSLRPGLVTATALISNLGIFNKWCRSYFHSSQPPSHLGRSGPWLLAKAAIAQTTFSLSKMQFCHNFENPKLLIQNKNTHTKKKHFSLVSEWFLGAFLHSRSMSSLPMTRLPPHQDHAELRHDFSRISRR